MSEREDLVDHHWIAEHCGVEKEDAHLDVIERVGYNLAVKMRIQSTLSCPTSLEAILDRGVP